MKFEEAIEKLQKITQELEEGELPLEEALDRFEEGMKLIGFCEKRLEEVEKRIQILIKEKDEFKLKEWEEMKETKENEDKKDRIIGLED
ncbi:MAG: exodeoxyribonuclease VII small subunit [Candidatus Aerophobetes bacterium]|nr:exodeoxyribonuclease VII small subunit [Candidatus Aerophobetes bacterium]